MCDCLQLRMTVTSGFTEKGVGALAYREQQYKTLTSGYIQKGGTNKDDKHH